MSEEIKKNVAELADEKLDAVSGGVSKEMIIAQQVLDGKWGNGDERVRRLKAAGYDPAKIQALVNDLDYIARTDKSLDAVARDVINGKYGNGEARVAALKRAGFDPKAVQDRVNALVYLANQ